MTLLAEYMLPLMSICLILAYFERTRKHRHRYPPGPPGLPILGNILNFPKSHDWLMFQSWSEKYGSDIVHFKLFGEHVFVLNSAKVTRDLFEKRSNIYSDRERTVMIFELTGWGRNIAFMEYGDRWRNHRRLFHQYFRPNAVPAYHPPIALQVRNLLVSLLDSPQNFLKHIRYMAGSTALSIVYAIDTQPNDDPILEVAEKGAESLFEIGNAGSYLVNSIPILKYLPAWFPGAEFKRQAAEWKRLVDAMHMRPYEVAKAAYDVGSAKPCVATALLERLDKSEDKQQLEDVIINVTAIAYQAGTDTTVTALSTFVLAMLLYPEIQVAARAKMDGVIGQDRLPTLEDRKSLPYITAITKEVLRWHPVLPLAVAHKTTADDEYEGYFIPRGSLVVGNGWAILRNKDRYPQPEIFDPSRFLTPDGTLDLNVLDSTEAFGYSRRVCPGRYFAMDVVWLTIANVLAAFTIENPVDEKGNVVKAKEEYTTGTFSSPKNLKASFKPRSSKVISLVH